MNVRTEFKKIQYVGISKDITKKVQATAVR